MIVLGGGIGGLTAAHYLIKKGHFNIKIVEASERVGGWIRSYRDQKTGLIFEKGPRSVRVNGHFGFNTLSLIEEIGIGSKIKPILKSDDSSSKRYIYMNNRLSLFPPNTFLSLFSNIQPFSKPLIYSFYKDLITPRKVSSDDTVYNFVDRRFGREVADYLVSPLICGICAGDAKEISVKFLVPRLFQFEQQYGSVIFGYLRSLFEKKSVPVLPEGLAVRAEKEKWVAFGLDGGLFQLPLALEKNVLGAGGQIMFNSRVTKIIFQGSSVRICIGEKKLEGRHLISSLPARSLAPLLKNEHPSLASMLSSIPYVTVCVVTLAYKENVLRQNGFGFLIPPIEENPILGVIFDSCIFPQGDWTVLTAMLGGKWFNKFFGNGIIEDRVVEIVRNSLKTILGINEPPVTYHISVLKDCIPQYVVGHYDVVTEIFSYIKSNKLPLSLIGSSYTGVGINDVIISSRHAIDELLYSM